MFTEQVLNVGVDVDPRSDLVTAAQFKPLIRAEQIAVRKQYACAKIRIHEEVTVVASADESSGK